MSGNTVDPYELAGIGDRRDVDRGRMLHRVYRYPEDLEDAKERYMNRDIEAPGEYRGIVVIGMGGSAIGGLFLRDLLFRDYGLPVLVERHMELPGYVNENYLTIVVSYSGNTEETLRGLRQALERGVRPVCLTSDGRLYEIAERRGFNCYKLPEGLPPRVSFPYMAVALLSVLRSLGRDYFPELEATISRLREIRDTVFKSFSEEGRNNIVIRGRNGGDGIKDHILDIVCGMTPVTYSYAPYISPGYRSKTQFNENAKIHAFYSELPESNHNEIMGWDCAAAAKFKPIVLRGSREHEAMAPRIDFLRELWEEVGASPLEINVRSDSLLEELLTMFFVVDAVSVVTAIRRCEDPTPVDTISRLKRYLAERIPPESYLSGLL